MRLMLDTQIYDRLAAKPGLIATINGLQHANVASVVSTQIQEDELTGITEPVKASEVAKVRRELVPTAGAVYGVSKYGTATYGDGSASGISIDDVRSASKGHTRDALIATSASMHADVLVTDDGRLTRRLRSLSTKCDVWSFAKLESWIASQSLP
jgi:hypothetical protein